MELDEAMETQTKEPTPDEVLEKTETSGLVRGIIESLPDLSREAITLFYISDLSHAEIAAFLEIPVSTVEKRLHDGRKRMKKGIVEMTQSELQSGRHSRDDTFSTSVVETIRTAVVAISQGDCERLERLLKEKPSIVHIGGALDPEGEPANYFTGATLLHYTAGNPTRNPMPPNILDVVRVLLDTGADPNAKTELGNTVVTLVASGRIPREAGVQINLIDLLVERGADVNEGQSGIEVALYHGETDAARALFRHGAKVDLRTSAGLGELDLVEKYFNEDGSLRSDANTIPVYAVLEPKTVADELVLQLPLERAINNKHPKVAAYLLDKGADVNSRARGMTPLHLACSAISQDGPEMVEWLLDHGADPSIQDNVGPNLLPINWAVQNNRPRSLAYLIDRGHGTDTAGMSPTHYPLRPSKGRGCPPEGGSRSEREHQEGRNDGADREGSRTRRSRDLPRRTIGLRHHLQEGAPPELLRGALSCVPTFHQAQNHRPLSTMFLSGCPAAKRRAFSSRIWNLRSGRFSASRTATWGVISTLGNVQSLWSDGSGSTSNTSRPQPPMTPFSIASASSSMRIVFPRPMLMK